MKKARPKRGRETQPLLQALDGDKNALRWLEANQPGLFRFARAVRGGRKARADLKDAPPGGWDDLFEAALSEELATALVARHPDVHAVFTAVKGDDETLRRLRREKPALAELAVVVRELHESAVPAPPAPPSPRLPEDAAADVGCLVGELHLSRGEYEKAVEAFTRAIENQPTADAHEGRARAFRALAEGDDRRAEELRPAGASKK